MDNFSSDKDHQVHELRFLLNNMSHAILFESINHEIFFVNQSFCDLFTIPLAPEALTGADCSKAAEQSSGLFKEPAQFTERICNIYKEQQAVENEELHFVDGSNIYRDYRPINSGQFIGHLWIYKNFQEVKSILNKVKDQNDFYQHLLNNIPADIAIFDKDHKYLFMNSLAVSLNETRNWLIGKDDFDYCKQKNRPVELAENRRKLFQEAIKTEKTVEFEEINYAADGSKVFNLRRFYPVKNPNGTIQTVIGYGINITKIKERELILLEGEKNMRALLDSMDQLAIIISETLVMHYTNPQWRKSTGVSFEDSVKRSLVSFISKNKESFIDNVTMFIKNGEYKTKNRIVEMTNENGIEHVLTYYISAFTNYEFKERRFAIFFNDITTQLNAENELKKIAKQERKLNELKSNFMNLVSHELRTPLTVILSNVELIDLINGASKGKPVPDIYTRRITEQVDEMVSLINNFLFVSKAEAGKIQCNPSLFDIIKLIDKLKHDLYSPWKDGRKLQVSVQGKIRHVMADESMISHCLINIINNAFKYSPGKPEPELHLNFNLKNWEIIILDFGIGIPQEDMKNLFQPFTRGNNVNQIEGTGLGLTVVKLFVKQNKGTVSIRSNKHDTAFMMRFPY